MKSIIKKAGKKNVPSRFFICIFFAIFAAFGVGFLYPIGIRPIYKIAASRSWKTVPCKIVSAEVETHADSEGDTYSIEIQYEYQFNERSYHSDKYSFIDMSSNGQKNKAKVVKRYKNAQNPVCFVNPDKPSESVLHRGFQLCQLFALLPLTFCVVGFGGIYWTIFKQGSKKIKPTCKQWLPKTTRSSDDNNRSYENPYQADSVEDFSYADSGMTEIKSSSPFKALLIAIAIAAFWNGIVSVFVFELFNNFEWFLALFLVPFVLVGLCMIGYVVMRFLMLFNPRSRVLLSTAKVKPGSSIKMQWRFSGRTSILEKLSIVLRAKEKATYRRGTDTTTDTRTFFQMEILSTDDYNQIPFGDIYFAIPEGAMHSFDAPNNKIVWEIALAGEIKSWPDVNETYNITVIP